MIFIGCAAILQLYQNCNNYKINGQIKNKDIYKIITIIMNNE